MEEDFEEHLARRGLRLSNYLYVDYEKELVTFPLYNLSGILKGVQTYNWKSEIRGKNTEDCRYYNQRDKTSITYFTTPDINIMDNRDLHVVEGIWDAIRVIEAGYKCIAVMTSTPMYVKQLLETIPCKTIALCDGDKAGKMLSRATDERIILPEDKDPNDMTQQELIELLK